MALIPTTHLRIGVSKRQITYKNPETQEWEKCLSFRCGPQGNEVWVKLSEDGQSVLIESKLNNLQRTIYPYRGRIWISLHFEPGWPYWADKILAFLGQSPVQVVFFSTRPST